MYASVFVLNSNTGVISNEQGQYTIDISSFGLQCLINIFSSIGLIPTKGMTLPFVSYGGSSMISIALLFGFLLSLTNKKNESL